MDAFFIGLHQPSDGKHFSAACISINRLRGAKGRKAPLPAKLKRVLIDSAAFTELNLHCRYRHSVKEYADDARPWCLDGRVVAIVAQDYMCEPFMLAKTGLTVAEHQRLTIERYDELHAYWFGALGMKTPIMPVLQGWDADDYVRHLEAYGARLTTGMWVGVGSVCKRQSNPAAILAIFQKLKRARPDLRFHAFGVKLAALNHPELRALISTADSTAWSYRARRQRGDDIKAKGWSDVRPNDWRHAKAFERKVWGRA